RYGDSGGARGAPFELRRRFEAPGIPPEPRALRDGSKGVRLRPDPARLIDRDGLPDPAVDVLVPGPCGRARSDEQETPLPRSHLSVGPGLERGDVREVPKALGEVEPVADHELRRDLESHVPQVERDALDPH